MEKQHVNDRREQERTHLEAWDQVDIDVWLSPGKPIDVTLVNIAEKGIGVMVSDASDLKRTRQVKVDYQGIRRIATIAHVTPIDSGEFVVGLTWLV